jgi:hypothetical protein
MTAVIADTNSKRIAEHHCPTWAECYEWAEQYIQWHGLVRMSHHVGNGVLTTWVKA